VRDEDFVIGDEQIRVLKDVKLLKLETWWKKTRDRNICGRIIEEAKVYKRLTARGRKR
jgi:hypothetical protein